MIKHICMIFLEISLMALVGCASTEPVSSLISMGSDPLNTSVRFFRPQITIKGSLKQVKQPLVQSCEAWGGRIEENSNTLLCAKSMGDQDINTFLYDAFEIPSDATGAVGYVRYSFAEGSGAVNVAIDLYAEYRTSQGLLKQILVHHIKVAQQAQNMLDRVKLSVEKE